MTSQKDLQQLEPIATELRNGSRSTDPALTLNFIKKDRFESYLKSRQCLSGAGYTGKGPDI